MTGHTGYKYLIIEVKTRTIVAIDFNSDTWNLYTADQIVNAPFCKGLNDIYRDGIYWVQYIFFRIAIRLKQVRGSHAQSKLLKAYN